MSQELIGTQAGHRKSRTRLRSTFNSRYFLFLLENFGSLKPGFIHCNKVSGRYRKLREAERKISSNLDQKRMVWCRVMTKIPKMLTTQKATTISM